MKNSGLDLKSIKPQLQNLVKKASTRITFLAILAILISYLVVVWRISSLATAEPPLDADAAAQSIPLIDKKAVEKISQLEASNIEVQALFNDARKNPFQE